MNEFKFLAVVAQAVFQAWCSFVLEENPVAFFNGVAGGVGLLA
ncbi:MAG: hypothetical protein ACFCU1_13450 [Sumerlaeia bacterium]